MGSADVVSSPTFTISKRYSAQDRYIHHYDFYRLNEPGIVAEQLAEAFEDEGAVTCIEWADIVEDVLPNNAIYMRIERVADSVDGRSLIIDVSKESAYILGE